MSTPVERDATSQSVRDAIALACGDNTAAAAYLTMIAHAARMLDDLHDHEGTVDVGYLAHVLLVALPRNSFFAQQAAYLIPLHDAAINAWQDANEMDPNGLLTASRYWSDWLNEIACVVAGLVGGYHHRRSVSPRIRMLLYPGWDDEESDKGLVVSGEPPCLHSSLTTNH
jgi:hypothetical protein